MITIPATAAGRITPEPEATALTTLISLVNAVAVPCVVPAALIPTPIERMWYAVAMTLLPWIFPEEVTDVNVPVDVMFGWAAVYTVPAINALAT